jgi:tripartite-type tricarboxylate transporter receptor subunit TctC
VSNAKPIVLPERATGRPQSIGLGFQTIDQLAERQAMGFAALNPSYGAQRPDGRNAMARWTGALAALAALTIAGAAYAQEAFPSKPVHLLVPFPPGGAVDIVARTLSDELSKRWGQPIVVENRPGAGGTLAGAVAAKAAPDGYTLILVASGHAVVSYLYPGLPYEPLRDFTPLSLVGSSPNMLLVRADSPLRSIADALNAAREKPGQLSYGYAGNGTSPHLAGELLKYMTKVDITPVPYKGGAPVLNDLLGGHIPMSFNNIPESIGQVQAGKLRPIAVTTATRSPVLPDVPTIAETGLPGYDTGVWWGFLAPAGLPADVKAKLAKDCAEAVQVPAVRERLLKLGATPIGGSPEEFDALIRSEHEKWGPVIKAAGIKGE